MKAAVYDGKSIEIRNVEKPTILPTQVLVKVKAVGVCGTDRAIIEGHLPVSTLPLIPGHEIVGKVIDVGHSVDSKWLHARVACEINSNIDFSCFYCQNELFSQCCSRKALGIDLNGGFAEYIAVEQYLLHKIHDEITDEDATFIEPLAAAYQTFEVMPLNKLDTNIVIFGMGKLGLLLAQVAQTLSLDVVVVDGSNVKLALAQSFGITKTINRHEVSNIPEKVRKFTREIGADIVVDTTGNPAVIPILFASCRTRGKIHMKSTHGLGVSLNLTDLVVREITIHSSRCGPFEKAIQGILTKAIKLDGLITRVFPLEEIQHALEAYQNPDNIKCIIKLKS